MLSFTAPVVTTLCSVKQFMQISDLDTTRDGLINQLIPQVSDLFRKYTNRDFGTFEHTHFFSGNGTPCLKLRERPVTPAGLRVWVNLSGFWGQGLPPDGDFPDADELLPGSFALDLDLGGTLSGSGLLYRTGTNGLSGANVNVGGAVWPLCKTKLWLSQSPDLAAAYTTPTGNIKVKYTAGELPPSVTLAANITIASILQSNQFGAPLTSESYEDYSRTMAGVITHSGLISLIPPYAMSVLAGYKELAW